MSFFICDKYKAKFDSIFQQIGKATNSIWKGKKWSDYVDALIYSTYIKGQEISLILDFSRSKTMAKILIKDENSLHSCYFRKEIFFSRDKAESKILKDFLERLEVDSLEDKINKILEIRQSKKEKEEYEQFRIEAFRRVLPFDKKAYNGKYSAYMDGVTVLFEPYTNLLEIKGNSEMALKICGKIAELLNQ